MRLFYADVSDIEEWMRLIYEVRWNFPGLETAEKLEEYRQTVLKFMGKRQAICIKHENAIKAVMLFSRGRNMICCLAAAPDFRRKGAASMLMDEALSNLDRTKEITVSTFRAQDEKGSAPRALYEKYGFVPEALIEEMDYPNQRYVLYPEGAEKKERQISINRMVRSICQILSDNRPSVYLYGSCALNDFRIGWSDIDILVLTEKEISASQAEKLVFLRQEMLKKEPGNPYYRQFEGGMLSLEAFLSKTSARVVYWGTSGERITDQYHFDSFCMAQLMESGVLLGGQDIRNRLRAPAFEDLREDIGRHLETIRKYAGATGASLYTFGWMLDIARCLYTLHTGKIIAKTDAGKWALSNRLCPDKEAMEFSLKVRENPKAHAADSAVFEYAMTLNKPIQEFADVLEKHMKA